MGWLDWGGIGAGRGGGAAYGEPAPTTLAAAHVLGPLDYMVEDTAYDVPSFLDQTPPTVTVSGASVAKVSTTTGHDIDTLTFTSSKDFQAYRVEQVASGASAAFSGTLLTSGGAGTANAATTASITGETMRGAGDPDGAYTAKVFCQDYAGNWST